MTHVDIVDALSDTEHWLNWSRFFGPISGHDAKLENPRERYLGSVPKMRFFRATHVARYRIAKILILKLHL